MRILVLIFLIFNFYYLLSNPKKNILINKIDSKTELKKVAFSIEEAIALNIGKRKSYSVINSVEIENIQNIRNPRNKRPDQNSSYLPAVRAWCAQEHKQQNQCAC